MTAVLVPWQMSSGADWPFLLAVGCLVMVAFYPERRPSRRQVMALCAFVLLSAGVIFADDDLVMLDICTLLEPWSAGWILNGCWW